MELHSMPGEQAWKPAHTVEIDKENADTPSKQAHRREGPLKSPASNTKRRPLSSLGGSSTKQKPAKRARKSMGRRVSFAPDQRLEQTHFYERETASSPLPFKDLEAMAARINGPVLDGAASEPDAQAPVRAPSSLASPAPSSVDMELTGVSDYGASEMSGPLPRFTNAVQSEGAAGEATGTDITGAAAAQWASMGMLDEDTGDVALEAPAAAAVEAAVHAIALEAEVAIEEAAQPTQAEAAVAAEPTTVAACSPASPAVVAADGLGRQLSGSPGDSSGPSMAPDADTPVRDLTMNITARLGGLSAVLEDDAEWQSSSCSRSNASPGAWTVGPTTGEDTTVHQLATLSESPGDGDVSMELTNIYAEEPEAVVDDPVAAEPAAPVAQGDPEAAVPEGAAQPADTVPADEQPAAALQDDSAVTRAASPEPLMQLEDAAAEAPVAEAAQPVEAEQVQAPVEAAPQQAVDPYELPTSPAQGNAEAQQQGPVQLPGLLDVQSPPEAERQQLLMSPPAAAFTALSSQLAVGSPPLELSSPQLLQLDGELPQPAASGGQSDSFCNQSGQPGLPSLDLSPVQEEQRDKWGCVPGAEYTQDIDMAAAARGFMGERTFNEVWVESDRDDEVTGPARAGVGNSPLTLGTPPGVDDVLPVGMERTQDLGPGADTPSGAAGGWDGGRRDSIASRRSSRSSFGGTDTTGHLLDMDMDDPLEPADFQDSPGGMNHFPSPGVPAGADGNTGNLLAEDFGGGGLQEALQRLRGSLQEPQNHQEARASPERVPRQSEVSGLGRTASTNGGATASLLQPTGHTHTDLLATPQGSTPAPGTARRTNGTTAHLLDFTAASANHFGRHSSSKKRASTAGSLMDDDMQLTDLTDLMQLGKQSPQAADTSSLLAPVDAAQPEPELSEGPAAAVPAPEQVPTPGSVGSRRRCSVTGQLEGNAALELQAQEQSPYWVPPSAKPSPIIAGLPAGGSTFPGGELLARTPMRALDMQQQPRSQRSGVQMLPPPSASPVARAQQEAASGMLPVDMLQTPASAPRSTARAMSGTTAPLMAVAFPTPPSVAPSRTHPGVSLMDASPAAAMPPLGDATNANNLGSAGGWLGRTPRHANSCPRLPPTTPRSMMRHNLLLTPRSVGGVGPALARPLALAEVCAKMGIQLHEHMRVPRQSMAGGLGIDAPPADLKEALQQEARLVEIRHADEYHQMLVQTVDEWRNSLAEKDADMLAAQPPLVRDLQLAEALQKDPTQFADIVAAIPSAFEHILAEAEGGPVALWAGLQSLKAYGSAAAPDAVAAAAATDLQAARQRCAELWALKKSEAQLEFKAWAEQRTAGLNQKLTELEGHMVRRQADAYDLLERLGHEHAAAHAHAQRAALAVAERDARHQAEKDRRMQLAALRQEAEEAAAASAARTARLDAASRQQEELKAERDRVDAAHAAAQQRLQELKGREGPGAGAGTPEATAQLAQEAEEAMHQWDMLDITRGLAGWRLVAASTLESPSGGDAPAAAMLAFQLAGDLVRLTLTLRPADADEGSSSCLEVDEDAACVPPQLRGLAAAVIGAELMGTRPIEDASQAGIASLLDVVAARAGRAADLLAEASALRGALPRLSQLAWLPEDNQGDACFRLRLGMLCMETGARLHVDLAIGNKFCDGALDCSAHVSFPGTARISPAAVTDAVTLAAPGPGRLARIAAALSRLVATPPAADAVAASPAAEPTLQAALAAAAQPESSVPADDGPAEPQPTPVEADGSNTGAVASNGAGAAASEVMTEAGSCQPPEPAAAPVADVDMPDAMDDAAPAEPSAADAVATAVQTLDSEQLGTGAAEEPPAEVPEPPPQHDDAAAQQADASTPGPCASPAEQSAAAAAESTPAATAAEGGAAAEAAPPAAEPQAMDMPAEAVSPAGSAAAGGKAGGDEVAASPNCGQQLPCRTPMNVISNPLYASTQRT